MQVGWRRGGSGVEVGRRLLGRWPFVIYKLVLAVSIDFLRVRVLLYQTEYLKAFRDARR